MDKHAIQLHDILVSHLSVIVNDQEAAIGYDGEITLLMKHGTSDFVKDDPYIAVGMKAKVTPEAKDGEAPSFVIEVELAGQFSVDYEKFRFEDLERWAKVNAPSLLLPYLREQIYGLGSRAGLRSMIIPLFNQPRREKPAEV